MTREEAVEHWKYVVHSVYVAERNIHDELKEMMKSNLSDNEKAEKYFEMVARELLKSTSDEELEKM